VTTPAGTPIHPQFRIIDGLSIRFTESEGRNDDALRLSPWPERLFAFEPIWAPLADHAHLVAIDLPGFCRSGRRDDLLSPPAMGEFALSHAQAALRFCDSDRQRVVTGFAAASAVDGTAAGASTGRDAR
jgi:pimeloyl-ACP methyl ester carboxylesterase